MRKPKNDIYHPSVLRPDFLRGLLPVIVQNANTLRVLMLAWANEEAFEKTLETGYAHFFSRSRNCLWKKGETSGNLMKIVDVKLDCDGDALVYLVKPSGPACHTGKESCFWRSVIGFVLETQPGEKIKTLRVHQDIGGF